MDPARQERTGTEILVGDGWRVCSNPTLDFSLSKGGDDGSFARQELAQQGDEVAFHGAVDADDPTQTVLPQVLHGWLGNLSPISEALAAKCDGHPSVLPPTQRLPHGGAAPWPALGTACSA